MKEQEINTDEKELKVIESIPLTNKKKQKQSKKRTKKESDEKFDKEKSLA